MSKRIKYIVVIALLLGLNLTLFYSGGIAKSSSFDDAFFLVKDTTQIYTLTIENKNEKIELKRSETGWLLNGKYKVDQNFLKVLFSILNKVKVKRQLGELASEDAGSLRIEFDDKRFRSFHFTSDPIGTKSFFIEDGIGYQVEVPGYRDNVVNIFELNEDQWRNRMVFDGSWRTIQNLTLQWGSEELTIRFNNQFFDVEGISLIDSSGVVDYLNQFQLFQANEMISEGRFSELDKVKSGNPLAVLRIDDIKNSLETVFEIYPNLDGQAYHLVIKNDKDMMVIDQRRIQNILKSRVDFKAE